jgi:hypothetical protein
MRTTAKAASAIASLAVLVGACGTTAPSTSAGTSTAPSAPLSSVVAASPSSDPWTVDLATLDESVRRLHPAPFTIHPEADWIAKLAELRSSLPSTASRDEQLVKLASLVGLLDTHSYLEWPVGAQFYEVLLYPFSDGVFVVRAGDPTLVGARLVSIGGVPVGELRKRLAPLVPHDNESGLLDGIQGILSSVEFLHGAGIVKDPTKPQFAFERTGGATAVVDPATLDQAGWESKLEIVGDLLGDAPEAVARRTEPVWWRVEAKERVFQLAYSDYVDPTDALTATTSALDAKQVDRVLLDLRYLRGGNGSIAFPLVEGLAKDPRVNRVGGLTVLIGRENVSAGTVIVRMLDEQTKALFVGEPTPARADNFLCECVNVTLPESGFVVGVPTDTFHTGDQRPEIAPDVPMTLAAKDFFAGHDPVLAAALAGLEAPTPS